MFLFKKEKPQKSKDVEKYKLLYDMIPLAYQSLDNSGRIIDVNPVWLETFGYTKKDVMGKNISKFLPKKFHEKLKKSFSNFLKTDRVETEFDLIKKNGKISTYFVTGRIARDSKGKFLRTHCILFDFTEKSMLEKNLKKKNKELEKYNKFFVDREVKMTELKKRIKELEEQLKD